MQMACEKSLGGMAAIVGQERAEVSELCKEFDVEAANFNAPGQIIISGEKAKIETAVNGAKAKGWKKVMQLNVAGAYHSRLMEPARLEFAQFLQGITFNAPKFAVFTNTTGQAISDPSALREALIKQVVSSVLWEDCMRSASAAGATEYWELGVGGVLAGLARRIDKSWPVKSYSEFIDLSA
jgi:[acyl-carrier-protein] S-malonyltransferase